VCLDERGPESAKSVPGRQLVSGETPAALAPPERPTPPTAGSGVASPIGRAPQESDDGRRGKGDVFGAFKPADGAALTAPSAGRTPATYVDFLTRVAAWMPSDMERIDALRDHLSAHRATDVLLCSLAHPRWEFVFQPQDAPYLNLIEPWWQVLRSLALQGRRFETWAEVCDAGQEATAYWNAHRHPLIWGQRRRHRPRRRPGIG
jgi:DDE superfamily endonuclease